MLFSIRLLKLDHLFILNFLLSFFSIFRLLVILLVVDAKKYWPSSSFSVQHQIFAQILGILNFYPQFQLWALNPWFQISRFSLFLPSRVSLLVYLVQGSNPDLLLYILSQIFLFLFCLRLRFQILLCLKVLNFPSQEPLI
jgi:hypothetical protein